MRPKPTNHRMTTRQSVVMFVQNMVYPAPGEFVGAAALYHAYRQHAERFGYGVSKEKFCRILDRHGYRRRIGRFGDLFEDIKLA